MQTRQKKPPQPKICQCCGVKVLSYWKTFTIDGVKKKACQKCSIKLEQKKQKEKKEKLKIRKKEIRDKKRNAVTFQDCKKMIQRLAKLCNEPVCCTSGYNFTEDDIKTGNMQGGHWRSAGSHRSTALYILNIHPQSFAENCGKHGNEYEYSLFIDKKYGVEFKEKLYKMSLIPYKWSQAELIEFKQKCMEHLSMLEGGVNKDVVKASFLKWQESTEWYSYMQSNLEKD